MIRSVREWLSDLRRSVSRYRRRTTVHHIQDTPPLATLDNIERKLDDMIIRKAGRDFLERALTNTENRR